MNLSEWEAKAWLGVLAGVVLGCVATVWMAVENEIDHYYTPSRLEVGPVEWHPPMPRNTEAEEVMTRWAHEKQVREGNDPDQLGTRQVVTE